MLAEVAALLVLLGGAPGDQETRVMRDVQRVLSRRPDTRLYVVYSCSQRRTRPDTARHDCKAYWDNRRTRWRYRRVVIARYYAPRFARQDSWRVGRPTRLCPLRSHPRPDFCRFRLPRRVVPQ